MSKIRSVLIVVSLSLTLQALPAWAVTKQAIAFPALVKSTSIGSVQKLLAKSSSGLVITYRATPKATCEIYKAKSIYYVRALKAGTCSVTAQQLGSSRYLPAKSVIRKFLINSPVVATPTPTPTSEPSPSPTVTPTPESSPSPSPTPTLTIDPTPTPTPTPTVSVAPPPPPPPPPAPTPTPTVTIPPPPTPTPTPTPTYVGTGLPRSQIVAGSNGLLGVVDKTQYSTSWAMYYGRGLGYKDGFIYQGSTFTLTWLITNAAGVPLANQPVTLQANKGYGGSTATFTYNSTPVINTGGPNDGARFAGTTNASGYVSFTLTDTTVRAEPASTSTTVIDPLAQANGGIYGQFGLQIGSIPQISQSMDIVDLHIISTAASPSPSPTPSPTATSPALVKGNLIWSDEFTGAAGSQANSLSWTARYCGQAAANGGGTCHNNEQQYYVPEAIAQDGTTDGNLVISTNRISRAPANGGICYVGTCSFTSGRLDTQGKVSFQYGYIEARIKMPSGAGNWPAFWALGTNITSVGWPVSGEIDIAEAGGDQPNRMTGALHYSTTASGCCGNHTYDAGAYDLPTSFADDFHLYALAWTENHLQLLVDGHVFLDLTPSTIRSTYWIFNAPIFLILNNAVGSFGGSWSGLDNSTMTIDYVRAYQLNGQGQVFNR